MNILDWVLICIGAFCILRGIMRGAISQICGIAGILAGFTVASHQYRQVGVSLTGLFPSIGGGAEPLSFVLLFVITWFVVGVLGFWIVRIIRGVGLGFLDRLWGAMIGLAKALLFAIVTVSILTLFTDGKLSMVAQSKLAPGIGQASEFLFKITPHGMQEELSRKQQDVKKLVTGRPNGVLESIFERSVVPNEKGAGNKN